MKKVSIFLVFLISVTDAGWENGEDTRNYLFTLINLECKN